MTSTNANTPQTRPLTSGPGLGPFPSLSINDTNRQDSAQPSPDRSPKMSRQCPSHENRNAPETEEQERPAVPRSPTYEDAIQFMKRPGQHPIQSVTKLRKYTVHALNSLTGQPIKKHKQALYDHVVSKLGPPATCPMVDQLSMVTTEDFKVKTNDPWANPTDVAGIGLIVKREEFNKDSQPVNMITKEMIEEEYHNVPGSKGGKDRWIKFSKRKLFQTPDSKDLDLHTRFGSTRDYLESGRGSDNTFVVLFDRQEIDITQPLEVKKSIASDPIAVQATIDAFVIEELKKNVLPCRLDPDSQARMVTRGNRIYGPTDEVRRGIEYRPGLQVGLVYTQNNTQPDLLWEPISPAHFFKSTTVSNFLVSYFGPSAANGMNEQQVLQASNMLNGLRVKVAVSVGAAKRSFQMTGLGSTARSTPVSLHGTAVSGSVDGLENPDLPTVNVGTKERPFLYPADLCRIEPDQPFTGTLPITLAPDIFDTTPKDPKTHNPQSDDIFSSVQPDEFKLFFVQLGDIEPATPRPVKEQAWNDFKHEIGQRYQKKLSNAVRTATDVTTTMAHFKQDLLRKFPDKLGVGVVVVVAVPKSIPSIEVDDIRAACDRALGAQCQIVSAPEVNQRYGKDIFNRSMVMYTGQVARKIFARASKSGSDPKLQLLASEPTPEIKASALVGVHVGKLKLPRNGLYPGELTDINDAYVLSIVSVTGSKLGLVHTTSAVFSRATADRDLLSHWTEHMDSYLSRSTGQVAIYVSGIPSHDQKISNALSTTIRSHLDSKAEKLKHGDASPVPRVALITMSEENQLAIASDQRSLPLTDAVNAVQFLASSQYAPPTDATEAEKRLQSDFHLDEQIMPFAFQLPSGYRDKDGSLSAPTQLWHTTYQQITHEDGQRQQASFQLLERRVLPAIVYLARAANKRAQLHVTTSARRHPIHPSRLEIDTVHESLKDTLYFL